MISLKNLQVAEFSKCFNRLPRLSLNYQKIINANATANAYQKLGLSGLPSTNINVHIYKHTYVAMLWCIQIFDLLFLIISIVGN